MIIIYMSLATGTIILLLILTVYIRFQKTGLLTILIVFLGSQGLHAQKTTP